MTSWASKAAFSSAVSVTLVWALASGLAVAQTPPATEQVPPPPSGPPPKSLLPAGKFAPPSQSETVLTAPAPTQPSQTPGAAPAQATSGEEGAPPQEGGDIAPVAAEAQTISPQLVAPDLIAPPATQAIGWLPPISGGFGARIWEGSSGAFLKALLPRVPAPTASRFGHILLRRALLSIAPPPPGALLGNFAAERAHLLLRMGEVDGAKAIIDRMPLDSYTRRLYDVAPQVHLAAGDIPSLCPLVQTGIAVSKDSLWPLSSAMCAAIQGDDAGAALVLDRERENRLSQDFDIRLTDRVATLVAGGNRGINVGWPAQGRLTTFRLSLALMGGVPVPREVLSSANSAVRGWLVRHPNAPLPVRIEAANTATATGVMSGRELVNLWSLQAAGLDSTALAALPVGKLRTAYVAGRFSIRLAAMQDLWSQGAMEADRAAMKIVTAGAAAGFPVYPAYIEAAPQLVRSLLMVGDVKSAQRWWDLARAQTRQGNSKAGASLRMIWPLVTLAQAKGQIPHSGKLYDLWSDTLEGDRSQKQRVRALAAASLIGMGLLDKNDIPGGDWPDELDTSYVKRIRAAAANRQKGEVIVLAALGLGTDPTAILPAHLLEVTRALKKVGLVREAGLIAAEALIRNGA